MQEVINPAQAAEKIWNLLISIGSAPFTARHGVARSVPKAAIDDELLLLRLFVSVLCLKFTRHASWRENGQMIHDITGAHFLERILEHDSPNAMEVYQHRMLSYGSSVGESGGDIALLAPSIGKVFATNCGSPNDPALHEIGSMELGRTFDAFTALFDSYSIADDSR